MLIGSVSLLLHSFDIVVIGTLLLIVLLAGESGGKAMARIYGNIGFKGLWNGLPVRILMIGTLTAFQWLIYDSFKVRDTLPFYFSQSLTPVLGITRSSHNRRPLKTSYPIRPSHDT